MAGSSQPPQTPPQSPPEKGREQAGKQTLAGLEHLTHTLSLRAQVAFVIAGLSFLPNLMMIVFFLLPTYRRLPDAERGLSLTLIVWMVVLVAISAGVGYVLSRQLLSPLLRLNREVNALKYASQQSLAESQLPVRNHEPRETLALTYSFNELLRQVRLEQSRRRSFMATLMHDLKTPLVAANHLLGVIRDNDALSRDKRVELVDQIFRENRRLIELVQKLVEAHRYERDEVTLKLEPTDLGDLATMVLDRAKPLAAERGIDLVCRGTARATVDPKELERALYNLVSNAVRYARSEIRLELYSGLIRLSDDGPGLPAPLEQLAQPFNAQPVTIAGQNFTAGTSGLGMFIARRIVEAHGGRLTTEATGPSGTVLLIYLKMH
ncbi:MAG: HAMP domain-containing sensor histidine kinase [Trueperaceae bacterium]|nr:HAMP domain-containing sensor histidine kinase [Trueperaceae bacterium]